jgi:hypothetical protein
MVGASPVAEGMMPAGRIGDRRRERAPVMSPLPHEDSVIGFVVRGQRTNAERALARGFGRRQRRPR